jgi:hypothetical protein
VRIRKVELERQLMFISIATNAHISSTKININFVKPTGYVMHQQYVLPILYLCVLYLSENKQRLVPLTE